MLREQRDPPAEEMEHKRQGSSFDPGDERQKFAYLPSDFPQDINQQFPQQCSEFSHFLKVSRLGFPRAEDSPETRFKVMELDMTLEASFTYKAHLLWRYLAANLSDDLFQEHLRKALMEAMNKDVSAHYDNKVYVDNACSLLASCSELPGVFSSLVSLLEVIVQELDSESFEKFQDVLLDGAQMGENDMFCDAYAAELQNIIEGLHRTMVAEAKGSEYSKVKISTARDAAAYYPVEGEVKKAKTLAKYGDPYAVLFTKLIVSGDVPETSRLASIIRLGDLLVRSYLDYAKQE